MVERTLTGRSALVTGSIGGLGLVMARALAPAGASITLTGIEGADKGDPIARALAGEFGVAARYISSDVRDPRAVRDLVAEAGAIDILVNNAVVRHFAPIETFPLDKWN